MSTTLIILLICGNNHAHPLCLLFDRALITAFYTGMYYTNTTGAAKLAVNKRTA